MKLVLILFVFLNSLGFYAQSPVDVVHSYGAYPGFNDTVKDIAVQPDGKSIYVGSFTKYRGNICNRIVRLNIDGSIDTSFVIGTGFNNFVESISLQLDGKMLISGNFSQYQSVSKFRLIRLNSNGSIDSSFSISDAAFSTSSTNSTIFEVLVLNDDKILIGGYLNGNIARLNSDGSLDTTFNVGSGFSNAVTELAVQSDGKIIAGGGFTTFNNVTRNHIIRLNSDGTKDDSFSIGIGFDNAVKDIKIQSDGKILVCGSFSTYKGLSQKKLVRLSPNGSVDTTFSIGNGFPNATSFWDQQNPEEMEVDANGKILLVGTFSSYNLIPKKGFLKLNSDGTIDLSCSFTSNYYLISIGIGSDGKTIVGNDQYIYRVFPDGSQDTSLNYGSGFNDRTHVTLLKPNGKYLVGGSFSQYESNSANALVQFNADGSKDNTFNFGSGFQYGTINTLLLLPDGKIIVGGNFFYNHNGIYFTDLLKINPDGSVDDNFTPPSTNSSVLALAVQPDGKIIVGGNFTYINNTLDPFLIRLNANGTIDLSFDKGTGFSTINSPSVSSIVIQSDGKMLIGGKFSIYRNEPHYNIIRLFSDGNIDTSFQTGDGFDQSLSKIMLLPDGKIIAAGSFGLYDSQNVWGIAKLNNNGSLDSSFNTGFVTNYINDFVLQPDGKIITGGIINFFLGNIYSNFVRFNSDGSTDTSFNPGLIFNSTEINCLSMFPNGNILVGGNFETINGVDSSKLILLNGGEVPLSANTIHQQKLVVYPNPAKDNITVLLPENITNVSYTIIDVFGKIVVQNKISNSSINIQSLVKGIYFLKISSESVDFVSKFIKE